MTKEDEQDTANNAGPVEPAMNRRIRPEPTRIDGYEAFVSEDYALFHKRRADALLADNQRLAGALEWVEGHVLRGDIHAQLLLAQVQAALAAHRGRG